MHPYLDSKPFVRIKDALLFAQAKGDSGTVVWPGNIDIAPEMLIRNALRPLGSGQPIHL